MDIFRIGILLVLVPFIVFILFKTYDVAVMLFPIIILGSIIIPYSMGVINSDNIESISKIMISKYHTQYDISEIENKIKDNIQEHDLSEFALTKDIENKEYIIECKKNIFKIGKLDIYRAINITLRYDVIDGEEYILNE